jgi:hypothetical protein
LELEAKEKEVEETCKRLKTSRVQRLQNLVAVAATGVVPAVLLAPAAAFKIVKANIAAAVPPARLC